MGFHFMFDIFPFIFGMIFLIVIGMFVVIAVQGIGEWNKNNHSPRLTVAATVVAKRQNVSHSHHTSTNTSYYVTFQVESGDRMEFYVNGREYGMLVEGDYGKLSFQGTRYLGFSREFE